MWNLPRLLEKGQLVLLYTDAPQGRKYIITHSDWRRTTVGLTQAPFGKELGGISPPASLPFFWEFQNEHLHCSVMQRHRLTPWGPPPSGEDDIVSLLDFCLACFLHQWARSLITARSIWMLHFRQRIAAGWAWMDRPTWSCHPTCEQSIPGRGNSHPHLVIPRCGYATLLEQETLTHQSPLCRGRYWPPCQRPEVFL